MQCPFLKEAEVDTCRHAVTRTIIVHSPETAARDKCSSERFFTCPVYRAEAETAPDDVSRCPFLEESLMQYCGAAAITKYIPYSEASLSRCGTSAFQYCDLYLSMAHPDATSAVPAWLWFARNHMWLDVGEDGSCHVGIDALLAQALGEVERVSFVGTRGICHPAVTVSTRGIDIQLAFPNPMLVTGSNVYLRANPSNLTSDPYRMGWLFEGKQAPGGDATAGLTRGEEARVWMEQDTDRLSRFVHEQIARTGCVLADGGAISEDFLKHLDREQVFELFHRFFSPWTR
jgi:glycine cleavage system H lipoate-binding protein